MEEKSQTNLDAYMVQAVVEQYWRMLDKKGLDQAAQPLQFIVRSYSKSLYEAKEHGSDSGANDYYDDESYGEPTEHQNEKENSYGEDDAALTTTVCGGLDAMHGLTHVFHLTLSCISAASPTTVCGGLDAFDLSHEWAHYYWPAGFQQGYNNGAVRWARMS